jgi:hypothetical protein
MPIPQGHLDETLKPKKIIIKRSKENLFMRLLIGNSSNAVIRKIFS